MDNHVRYVDVTDYIRSFQGNLERTITYKSIYKNSEPLYIKEPEDCIDRFKIWCIELS